MTQPINPPRGTYDALPEQSRRLRWIETTAHSIFSRYGYGEIRTPMFEFTEVFARNVGDQTDIVTKEMYTFQDRGGESLSLRPEGTAGVVRAYYSNKLKHQLPLKLQYIGTPMFRYERPQKGRYRQHHQVGIECFGIAEPWADVEVIAAGMAFLRALGLSGLTVHINSLGTRADRAAYREQLLAYFAPVQGQLSAESQERLLKNPLRVLDSKQPEDQPFIPAAPKPLDVLSPDSAAFYAAVKQGLTALGIPYTEVPTLVRGLDYYTHTVFEIHSSNLGAQSQVLSGGRYDGLLAQMGPEDVPGVGFGSGIERLELLLADIPAPTPPISFVLGNAAAMPVALQLAETLRAAGHTVDIPLNVGQGGPQSSTQGGASFKTQFKRADKLNASHVIILGEDELAQGTCTLKTMANGVQHTVPQAHILESL